jgi:hypothetical protein
MGQIAAQPAQAGGSPTPPRPTVGGPGDPRLRPPRPLVSPDRDDGLLGTPLPAGGARGPPPAPDAPPRPPIAARSTMAARDLSSDAPAVEIERLDERHGPARASPAGPVVRRGTAFVTVSCGTRSWVRRAPVVGLEAAHSRNGDPEAAQPRRGPGPVRPERRPPPGPAQAPGGARGRQRRRVAAVGQRRRGRGRRAHLPLAAGHDPRGRHDQHDRAGARRPGALGGGRRRVRRPRGRSTRPRARRAAARRCPAARGPRRPASGATSRRSTAIRSRSASGPRGPARPTSRWRWPCRR